MKPLHAPLLKRATAIAVLAAATLAAICVAPVAHAEKADRKEKVNISSLDSEGDYGKGIYKLSRNVVVTQGTLKITADRADIRADDNEQYHAVLTAKPVCFRQRTDNGEWSQGIADRVEYSSAQGIVELFGNAVLFVGDDETRANYITYNTQSSAYEARDSKDRKAASTSGKGVTFVLQPREKDDKPAPNAASSAGVTSAANAAAAAASTAAASASPAAPPPVAPAPAAPKTTAKSNPNKSTTAPKRNEPAFSRCA
jgi:lipopolysaccharide export system protein LptA